MVDRYESARNYAYTAKLRAFLNQWRAYKISGSINRETLDPLESAADMLGVDNWKLNNFFSNLRDQLRRLIASEEQLPRDMQTKANAGGPAPGIGGGGPPSSDFGPEGGPEGGAPGGPDGAPGGAEGGPPPEGGAPGGPEGGAPPDGAPVAGEPLGAPEDEELPK